MKEQTRVQIIGNYLEPLVSCLKDRNIITDSIISGCNTLAMVGKADPGLNKFTENADVLTLLTVKKNLNQMLSRDPASFTQNYSKQPIGAEIRYFNRSEYIIISNTSLAYKLFNKDGKVYSELWPKNSLIKAIEKDPEYKNEYFPFSDDFNWKYYYDMFVDTILDVYDSEHIILINTNSSDWYMDKDKLTLFENKSAEFRRRIEEADEYFISRTGCFSIKSMYSFMPKQRNKGAFIYSTMSVDAYSHLADNLVDIISGKQKYHMPRKIGINTFYNTIFQKLNSFVIENNKAVLSTINNEIYSYDKLVASEISNDSFIKDILKLVYFINYNETRNLSDYYRDIIEGKITKIDTDLIFLYTKYFKITLNDIIAVFSLYNLCEDKRSFKKTVDNILSNPDCYPMLLSKEILQKNKEFISTYSYIQPELKSFSNENEYYIKLENDCYIVISPKNTNELMKKISLDLNSPCNYKDIIDNGYVCSICEANKLCENLKFYIEKAKRSDGNKPIVIEFDSSSDFNIMMCVVDFVELLKTESFILRVKNSDFYSDECKASTDLSFLFEKGTMICYLSSGLTDQICYYLSSKRSQELRNGNLYYDDIPLIRKNHFNGMTELSKIITEDISGRCFSNIFNKKLVKMIIANNSNTPDLLYKNGCKHILVVSTDKTRMKSEGVELCNRLFYTDTENLKDYFSYNFDLTYYLSLIRPEHIMRYSSFEPTNYIKFPEYDNEKNINIAKKMNECDSVAIHIRRGDFISQGVIDDMDFYKESLIKLAAIPDYPNKKFFIFSDDIPWCKTHLDDIGISAFPDADITFVDHNKGTDSFRDMQLMTEAKIHIGGSSGFARIIPLLSGKCEVYMQYNLPVMELYRKAGKVNKYDIGEYSKNYRTNWGAPNLPLLSKTIAPLDEKKNIQTEIKNGG